MIPSRRHFSSLSITQLYSPGHKWRNSWANNSNLLPNSILSTIIVTASSWINGKDGRKSIPTWPPTAALQILLAKYCILRRYSGTISLNSSCRHSRIIVMTWTLFTTNSLHSSPSRAHPSTSLNCLYCIKYLPCWHFLNLHTPVGCSTMNFHFSKRHQTQTSHIEIFLSPRTKSYLEC